MESVHAVSLVSKNVDLLIKYQINDEFEWRHGTVVTVFEYGTKSGRSYVDCNVEYDDDEVSEERLWDKDYDTEGEDAWKFSPKFVHVIERASDLLYESLSDDDCECDDCECEDCDCNDENDPDYEEEEEEEDEDTETEEEDEEEYVPIVRKKPSFLNQLGATLYVFAPLIATFVVIYNARSDVTNALCTKYCSAF